MKIKKKLKDIQGLKVIKEKVVKKLLKKNQSNLSIVMMILVKKNILY